MNHAAPRWDECHWLGRLNKAACVALHAAAVLDRQQAAAVARALLALDGHWERAPATERTGDYKLVEPMLVKIGGGALTCLQAGRSRVELVAAQRRLAQRQSLLAAIGALARARTALLDFADRHRDHLVPVYTQGRQAVAVPAGHYLGAYAAGLESAAAALRQVYPGINRSPLGACAGATSSFPLDRGLLGWLLGFDGVIENSLYATEMSILDTGIAIIGALNGLCAQVGMLLADLGVQYAQLRPWITLKEAEGSLTSRSTSMPHKVNPAYLNKVRMANSDLAGSCAAFVLKSHNVQHGMPDFKSAGPDTALRQAEQMLVDLAVLVDNLEFHADRARAEVEAEYTASTELADVLQQRAGVPFRAGHHFAAALVGYGKARAIAPADFPYEAACGLYADMARHCGLPDATLPLSAGELADALSPRRMVERAACQGGPQPGEVARMLSVAREAVDDDMNWLDQREGALRRAADELDVRLQALLAG